MESNKIEYPHVLEANINAKGYAQLTVKARTETKPEPEIIGKLLKKLKKEVEAAGFKVQPVEVKKK